MIQIFGWAILHSLWQIALIAAGYLVAKSLWKKATSLQQYYLALTAFVSSFLAPIFTFNYLWQQTVVPQMSSTLAPITNEPISITTTVGTTEEVVLNTTLTFADYLTICLPYLVVFWGLGVLYFTIRFFVNLTQIQRLQNVDNELITGEWLAKIRAFKKQLNIEKEVQVFLSKHVKEPITFGHFKPVILLPISLMTGFDAKAIETIVVHELAHIKRHDYLINLGQSIIEIILFYHPCIWWLSKEIRAIREHCCDDLVLSMGDNRDAYVETLTALQWRKIGVVSNSLSMTASGDDGDFTRRIKRMFGVEEEGFSFRQLMGVFLVLLVMAVGGVGLQQYFQPRIVDEQLVVLKPIFTKELSSLTINKDMSLKELFESVESFGKDSDTRITFNDIDFNDKNELTGKLRGTIRPNKSGVYHFFEIHDINKYSILFQASADTILAPKYISVGTGLISKVEHPSSESSKIKINNQTTRAELDSWAKTITRHGVIFNFEKSVFDNEGRLIDLNGKFNGQCCFDDGFYIDNLDQLEVHLEVRDNYIYQPMIVSNTPESATELRERLKNEILEKHNISNLYDGVSGDILWKLGSIEKMKIKGEEWDLPFEVSKEDSIKIDSIRRSNGTPLLNKKDRQKAESLLSAVIESPSSFIPQLKEKEDFQKYIDSVAQSSVGKNKSTLRREYEIGLLQAKNINEINFWKEKIASVDDMRESMIGNGSYNHAMLIPSEKKDIESIENKNLIYRGKAPSAVFTSGTLTPKEDLPKYLHLDENDPLIMVADSIRLANTIYKDGVAKNVMPTVTVIGRKDEVKDSLQNYVQWDNRKFELTMNPNKRGQSRLIAPKIEVTKEEWNRLRKAYFTFKIHDNWYKVKNVDNLVLVAKRKDPVSINLDGIYHNSILDDRSQVQSLLETANVGDHIYYEKIDFGGSFTLGIVVEIIEEKSTKATGFNVKKDVDYKDAETDFSKGFTNASHMTFENWKLQKSIPSPLFGLTEESKEQLRLIGGESAIFIVDGIKWAKDSSHKLDPEIIESIDIVSGTKAQLLYGVEKAVLITTKKVTPMEGNKN